MYNLIYDDIDFYGILKVLDVKKAILPSRTNYTVDIPNATGEHYLGFKYGSREIEIDVAIISDSISGYEATLRVLADAFNVDTPKRLYLGEELDKYYYAIPDVSDNLEQIASVGKGTIKFICYNPIAYTDTTKVFEGDHLSGITTINNDGTMEAYPVISVGFTREAHFVQATNYDGKTVLVGQRPSVDAPSGAINPVVLDDDCSTTANWVSSGNVLDSDVPREVMGTATINKYGTGITGNDYGSSDRGWHGSAMRRNLSSPVQDFDVNIEVAFDSKDTGVSGSGGGASSGSTSGKYTITADPSLRIREGRSTDTKQIGSIPRGKVVDVSDVSNGWGKVTYGGKTGYISMAHTKVYNAPSTNYKTTANLNLRKGRGTNNSIICTIPKGTAVNVTDISGGWGKVTYKDKTGYCSMDYLTATKSIAKNMSIRSEEFADFSKMGRLEVYLFDDRSQKIGKFVVKDDQEFYEFTQPEVWIGNNIVLKDNTQCPKPKTEQKKDGDNTITVNVDSGKYGNWNDGTIRLSMKRVTVNGVNEWRAWIGLVKGGTVVKQIVTNTLINSGYPTGKLSSIVLWFGQYKTAPVVDTFSVEDIEVINVNPTPETPVNEPIFKNGDELIINCEEHTVTLNGESILDRVDIGSEFFSSGSGDSQFIVVSDDRFCNVLTGIRERYL